MEIAKKQSSLITALTVVLCACGNDASSDIYEDAEYASYDSEVSSQDPYAVFCFEREIPPDIDLSNVEDDDCMFETEGRNRADITAPNANAFFATVSHSDALRDAGILSFGIDIKRGNHHPKIDVGEYHVTPYSVFTTENRALPEIMFHLRASGPDMIAPGVMQPDIDNLNLRGSNASGDAYMPPYEVVSASLKISHVEDVVLDEFEAEEQKLQQQMGMISGQQYVRGSLTFSIRKLGPNGFDFGPETFYFGSRNSWGYFTNP